MTSRLLIFLVLLLEARGLYISMIAFGYPGVDAVAGASVNNWSDERVHR